MKTIQKSNRIKGDLILLVVAIIWGGAFIAQRLGSSHLDFFYFNTFRFLLGTMVMLIILKFKPKLSSFEWKVGLGAGLFLFLGATLQQAGLEHTTAGKAGFITGLYVVIIPIILTLFWKERFHKITWAAIAIALLGMGFLSLEGDLKLSPGDATVLVSSFMWACHVIVIGKNINKVNVIKIAFIQNLVCVVLSFGGGLIFENIESANIILAFPALLFSGIASIGIAYTLQLVGQQYAPPVDSAIILSTESVFAMMFGITLLQESINTQQIAGCVLMFAAMMLAQVPSIREYLKPARRKGI